MKHLKTFGSIGMDDLRTVKDIMNVANDDDKLNMEIEGDNYISIEVLNNGNRVEYSASYEIYPVGDVLVSYDKETVEHLTKVCEEIYNRLKNDMIEFYALAQSFDTDASFEDEWKTITFDDYLKDNNNTLQSVEFFIV